MTSSVRLIPFLLLSAFAAPAAGAMFHLDAKNGPKQITFESRAPVEYIEGEATEVTGTITADFSAPGLGLNAAIGVPVVGMTTGMDRRDAHMRDNDWLDAARYPAIHFELDPVNAERLSPRGANGWAGTVTGSFSMKGIAKKISVPVTITQESPERLVVEGRFPVRLADHKVRGPITMRMIGLKVSGTVQVNFRLVGIRDKGWDNVRPAPTPTLKPSLGKQRLSRKKHK